MPLRNPFNYARLALKIFFFHFAHVNEVKSAEKFFGRNISLLWTLGDERLIFLQRTLGHFVLVKKVLVTKAPSSTASFQVLCVR